LVEVLIVVVVVGILVTVVAPKFSATKERTYLAAMKSDLRNLASAQERYFYFNADYYDGPVPHANLDFDPSDRVTITLSSVTPSGWAATSSYAGISATCATYYGDATPPAPAVVEGAPACAY
jgi:Tfp pilus assembly protein PilE